VFVDRVIHPVNQNIFFKFVVVCHFVNQFVCPQIQFVFFCYYFLICSFHLSRSINQFRHFLIPCASVSVNQCTHLLIPFVSHSVIQSMHTFAHSVVSHSFNQSVHAFLTGLLPSLLWPLCHMLEVTRCDVSLRFFRFTLIYSRSCSCKCWQKGTVVGVAVQNSQYGILLTLQPQSNVFNDTFTIFLRSACLPESNVAFMPFQIIQKCE